MVGGPRGSAGGPLFAALWAGSALVLISRGSVSAPPADPASALEPGVLPPPPADPASAPEAGVLSPPPADPASAPKAGSATPVPASDLTPAEPVSIAPPGP